MGHPSFETVFVAGATGDTGLELLRLLAPRVSTVRALTRSHGNRASLLRAGADEVVVDDVLDPGDLEGAVADADAVLSALGSAAGDVWRGGPLVDGAGTIALLEAAVATGVDRFVMESALGVGDEPASPLGKAFNAFIGPVQRAKADAEDAIRAAPIEYTIFRAGILTNGPRTDDVAVARPGAKLWGSVSRADVARLMIAAPLTEAATNETFEVVARPRFRGRSLAIDWRLPRRNATPDSTASGPD